jgi:uncharacterized membrane protein
MLPLVAVTLGLLPSGSKTYRALNDLLLPFALGLLLLGIDWQSVFRAGWRMLAATAIGCASIVAGAPLVAWLLRAHLPAEAWKGVGTLAATWTGGSMNLLAMRTLLQTPEPIFASLIIVDALIAYTWMALLVGLAAFQSPIDRWLGAKPVNSEGKPEVSPSDARLRLAASPSLLRAKWLCILLALALAWVAQTLSHLLPITPLVSSQSGWTVLLVTTFALSASWARPVQSFGRHASSVGYPCLYLVLAAVGSQANLAALWSAPIWVVLGACIALTHGISMLLVGKLLRLPLRILATASQANLGGVVSTPLVAAVYEHQLAPAGLLLAIGCNALGTYLGMCSAFVARIVLGG